MRHNPRELTYDEKKAAEAAYRGQDLDPSWSEAGQRVYIGMKKAILRQMPCSTPTRPVLTTRTAKELCEMFGVRNNQNKEG